ncbi:hypothetical protein MTP03_09720 [Tsukamurella sp. PLM1]|nr:hypothetical protein MTP03_09720 [Tsukamurella sp. PLM1]
MRAPRCGCRTVRPVPETEYPVVPALLFVLALYAVLIAVALVVPAR